MMLATTAEIEEACLTRGAFDAHRYLERQGLEASPRQCATVIGRLIDEKRRTRLGISGFATDEDRSELQRSAMAFGCRHLLRHQLETGAHWISDPAQMAAALHEAGMVA